MSNQVLKSLDQWVTEEQARAKNMQMTLIQILGEEKAKEYPMYEFMEGYVSALEKLLSTKGTEWDFEE